MNLREKIKQDMRDALKAGEKNKTSALRMLLSELQYAETAQAARAIMPDREVQKVVESYYKRLDKSLEDFPEGERRQAIRQEMSYIKPYLPAKAGEDEVRAAIGKVMAGSDDRNFGRLMKLVLGELGESADGKLVSTVLKATLQQQSIQ